jgi:hypothetical protein
MSEVPMWWTCPNRLPILVTALTTGDTTRNIPEVNYCIVYWETRQSQHFGREGERGRERGRGGDGERERGKEAEIELFASPAWKSGQVRTP